MLTAVLTFLIPTGFNLLGVSALDGQGYSGTLASLGFLVVYVLISISAPIYLKNLGALNKQAIVYAVLGTGSMILPVLGLVGLPGSKLFPPPAFPNNLLVWLFLAYMAIGLGWLRLHHARHPKVIPAMVGAIEDVELQFAASERIRKGSVL